MSRRESPTERFTNLTIGTIRRPECGVFDRPQRAAYIPLGISRDIRRRRIVRSRFLRRADSARGLRAPLKDVAAEPSMDDSTSQPTNSDTLSPRSAAALHELEERARNALSAQRGEMTRLEAEITEQ